MVKPPFSRSPGTERGEILSTSIKNLYTVIYTIQNIDTFFGTHGHIAGMQEPGLDVKEVFGGNDGQV